MAITLSELKAYCNKLELNFREAEERLVLVFGTKELGDIHMMIRLEEDGELFVTETNAIHPDITTKIEDKGNLFGRLLHFGWVTPFGSVEMDKDQEVRFRIEIPLEDNTLTFKQFNRIVQSAVAGTALIRQIAIKMIDDQGETGAEDIPDEAKAKIIILAVMKAKAILTNPESTDEEKQEAIAIIRKAQEILPEGILKDILAGEEGNRGKL